MADCTTKEIVEVVQKVKREFAAMQAIIEILSDLDEAAIRRVLEWVMSRFLDDTNTTRKEE